MAEFFVRHLAGTSNSVIQEDPAISQQRSDFGQIPGHVVDVQSVNRISQPIWIIPATVRVLLRPLILERHWTDANEAESAGKRTIPALSRSGRRQRLLTVA